MIIIICETMLRSLRAREPETMPRGHARDLRTSARVMEFRPTANSIEEVHPYSQGPLRLVPVAPAAYCLGGPPASEDILNYHYWSKLSRQRVDDRCGTIQTCVCMLASCRHRCCGHVRCVSLRCCGHVRMC